MFAGSRFHHAGRLRFDVQSYEPLARGDSTIMMIRGFDNWCDSLRLEGAAVSPFGLVFGQREGFRVSGIILGVNVHNFNFSRATR